MISPINVATQGLLNSPVGVAAVRGHLIIGDIVIPPKLGGGGKKGGLQGVKEYDITPRKLAALKAKLQNEDEEIISIITAVMEVIQ